MKIDDEVYREDLIILPDGSIQHPWWRTSGHLLTVNDVQPILATGPAFLIVGTGASGMMRPDAQFQSAVEKRGIQVAILPTEQAVHEFNRTSEQSESCAGCFHLTC
jgi:hypothetical protein